MPKAAKTVQSKPMSMEELLKEAANELKVPSTGDVVEGVVTQVTRKMVLIDVGGKTEGLVVDRELEAAKDYVHKLKVGDKVTCYVTSAENEKGQILLSLKRAVMDQRWNEFTRKMDAQETVSVKGSELNKGGMIAVLDGIRGFVPTSQFSKKYINDLESLMGKNFDVKVIEVDKDKNRLIFSERYVSEADLIAEKTDALETIKESDVYTGTVSGIMPFGIFITVSVPLEKKKGEGKIEGLVHISEISWEKVEDPHTLFKIGDEVKVKVVSIDKASGKITLSMKQLSDDPWSKAVEKYAEGSTVTGKISRIASFGVFVNLEPGVDGLIHISKIPVDRDLKVGDDITVIVEQIEPAARRMSLSLVLSEVPVGYK